jgi:hypothetical protein
VHLDTASDQSLSQPPKEEFFPHTDLGVPLRKRKYRITRRY